jgi:hypothetical protein
VNHRFHTSRRLTAGLLVGATLLTFAACSKDDDGGDEDSTATTTVSTKPAVVTKASDAPRTADYIGARKDVSKLTCKDDGKVWRVTGTVTNPTDAPADYRIFTSLLDGTSETRGLLQTDVKAIPPHAEKEWNGELELDADDLKCVLRVERTGVNGAPPPSEPSTSSP